VPLSVVLCCLTAFFLLLFKSEVNSPKIQLFYFTSHILPFMVERVEG